MSSVWQMVVTICISACHSNVFLRYVSWALLEKLCYVEGWKTRWLLASTKVQGRSLIFLADKTVTDAFKVLASNIFCLRRPLLSLCSQNQVCCWRKVLKAKILFTPRTDPKWPKYFRLSPEKSRKSLHFLIPSSGICD